MTGPDDVMAKAREKEDENYQFQLYLKSHADEDTLDQQIHELHRELFQNYDCSKCRNCCKGYHGVIPEEDIPADAKYLGIPKEQFKKFFLKWDDIEQGYITRHIPCDFLQEDGECMLGDCKPDVCKKYPYTSEPERMSSLLNMLGIIEVCPVAFEIFERLKKEYHFKMKVS